MHWSITRRAFQATLALLLGAAPAALAQGGPPSKDKDTGKPLVIAKQGYLFVGGEYHTFQGQQYVSGQAYVEYQIPQNQKHPYPIVMIEGFGLTGTNFTGTPEGVGLSGRFPYLAAGDVCELEIPGLGRQRQQFV